MDVKLTRETILKALALLDDVLRLEETTGEICIFGGAAMILAFDAGFATRDVDAIFVPKAIVSKAILQIADELDLPASWLNDGVKGFVSENEDFTTENMPVYQNLRVIRPSARYLLAMKCLASRVTGYGERGDVTDIKILWKHLNCRSVNEVMEIVLEYYPPAQIPAKTQFLIEEIFQEFAND
jgi:hypothetical protein